MCEHTRKLILWMDGELGASEAALVEAHVAQCAECRECLAAYRQASVGFEAYCDAIAGVLDEARAEKLREIPRRFANDLRPFATLTRDDNVKEKEQTPGRGKRAPSLRDAALRTPTLVGSSARDDNVKEKHGGLKPAATKRERVVRLGVGAMAAAAAAVAMVLMIPRHRVAQIPATSTARNAMLHAALRPAERPESIHENTAETMTRGGRGSNDSAVATHGAAAQNAATRSETLPGAHIAKRTAPLAVSTGTAQRPGAGRPARLERANGGASAQTAQNGQMRSASAALRPQGESKRQAENASATEPPIEISVPTENMFPPGAVPEGIGFTAVVTIAADDSAQLAAVRRR